MLTNQIVCSSIILPEIKSRVMWICSLQGPAIERDGIQKKKAGGSPSNECVCVCDKYEIKLFERLRRT